MITKEVYLNSEIKNMLFTNIAREWLDVFKPQLKKSSIAKYKNLIDIYLIPNFNAKTISEISRGEVTFFCNSLLESGGKKNDGLSPKTVLSIISVLNSIFEYASYEKNISVPNIKRISIKKNPKPLRVLSLPEQKRLHIYLQSNPTLCNLGILLCLYTGLRIGEVCSLQWEDIRINERMLNITKTMQRIQTHNTVGSKTEIIIDKPKSESSIRTIPIPSNIWEIIKDERQDDKAFFLTGVKDKYIEPRTLQYRFKQVVKECGIADVNFHALRHTFATRCVELGFDIKSLSEILGHASVNITLNKYVHPSMELKQKNMNMLVDLVNI